MKDLGFNSQASDSVKEAFIKHLIKQSIGINIQSPTEKKIIQENPEKIISFLKIQAHSQQLEFDFNETSKNTWKKAAV